MEDPVGDTMCFFNSSISSVYLFVFVYFFGTADWEEEAQGEDLLSDEEGDKEPEDHLDYKVRASRSSCRVHHSSLRVCCTVYESLYALA